MCRSINRTPRQMSEARWGYIPDVEIPLYYGYYEKTGRRDPLLITNKSRFQLFREAVTEFSSAMLEIIRNRKEKNI